MKKIYKAPELKVLKCVLTEDVLSASTEGQIGENIPTDPSETSSLSDDW